MGKTGKWLRSLLTGKKDKKKEKSPTNLNSSSNGTENSTTPTSTTPKEKRRWSFRRSSTSASTTAISTATPAATSKESNFVEPNVTASQTVQTVTDIQDEQRKHAKPVAAVQAVVAAIRLTSTSNGTSKSIEEAAAIKIQSVFRSHLARKALCALRGLVKLQALVRGHLVRKQAKATLRYMQALVTAQARACAQKIRMGSEGKLNQRQSKRKNVTEIDLFRHIYNEMGRGFEDNIKIVEMDVCESNGNSGSRSSSVYEHGHGEQYDNRCSTHHSRNGSYTKEEHYKVSPVPSTSTEFSPSACSGHFEDSFSTAQSSPQLYSAVSRTDNSKHPFAFPRPAYAESMCYDYPMFPNYMANTKSSRAKVRSHSAPKQRPDSFEKQPSRRRPSVEGRNVPRPMRMQRSSSHVGVPSHNYQYPWSIKLDRSAVSLKDSECGSASTVLTNTNYCRSLVAYDPRGDRY